MEYLFRSAGPLPALEAIERELAALDPAAVLDRDGDALRISTCATPRELLAALQGAGVAAGAASLEPQPSVCCGGCGFG